ncbi:MAG TPA: type II toxin-antitoxin system prevent-host-death family antitoxin [Chthoniobacteraceae bacterium]|jgi:prevent-host-death family protein
MKAKEVGVFEARSQLSKLVDEVVQSQTPILLTKHGKPVVQLAPLVASTFQRVRGCAASPDYFIAGDFDAPLEDFADYELSTAEMMKVAEQPPEA